MSPNDRALKWSSLGQIALNFLVVGILILVVMNDWRQSDSEKMAKTQAARMAETSALAERAEQRIAALEKIVAEAKADRDALRATAQKAQTEAGATKLSLAATSGVLDAANKKLADIAANVEGLRADEQRLEKDQSLFASASAVTRAELAGLKSTVAWRDLAGARRESLVAALSRGAPSAINLLHVANDSEAQYYAIQIGAAFRAAGWRVNHVSAGYSGVLITDLVLNRASDQATQDVIAAFQASGIALETADLPEPSQTMGGDREGIPVTLVVGSHEMH